MKIFLDTSAVNWLTEESKEATTLLELHRYERIQLAGLEVAYEVRKTPDQAKKTRLEEILEQIYPLAPTHFGRMGVARADLTIAHGDDAKIMWEQLKDLGSKLNRWDPTHLLNAHYEECDYFLHRDKGLRSKVDEIEAIIAPKLVHTDDVESILSQFPAN